MTPRVRGFRALVAASALALTVPLLGACGGSANRSAASPRLIARSADTTKAARTAHVAMSVRITADGSTAEIMHGDGVQSFADGTSELRMVTPLSELHSGVSDLAIDVKVPRKGETYESLPPALLPLPAGKHWVLITTADLGPSAAAINSVAGANDPAAGLDFLRGIVGAPEVVGSERVAGDETTHYRVRVDLDRLLELLAKGASRISPESRTQIEALRRQVDTSDLPGNVWLDAQNRVRRFTYTLTAHGLNGTTRVASTLEYSDFGAPVTVGAPPATEVVPFVAVADEFGQIRQRILALGGAAS